MDTTPVRPLISRRPATGNRSPVGSSSARPVKNRSVRASSWARIRSIPVSCSQARPALSPRIPGRFSVYNSLCAATVALALGVDFEDTLIAIGKSNGVKGRIEVVPTNTDYTVIIDYAHSPDGLENIISSLKEIAKGRVVTLFGCGGDRDKTKRPKMGKIAADLSDFCVVTSDNPRSENPSEIIKDILEGMKDSKTPYVVVENRKEAITWALHNAQKDDIILLAGKGHETYQILPTGTIHFDEREVVAEVLNS